MDARELLDDLESGLIDEFMSAEVKAIYIRALRLLAAAESNDGTTPVCDALREDLRYQEGCDWLKGFTELAERLEMERNGLAARVVELAPDAERWRYAIAHGWLRGSIEEVDRAMAR